MKSDEVFLHHILDETNFVLRQTAKLSYHRFTKDEVLKRACIRSIEIIGEASKNISPELKNKHKNIEWRRISGMRDRLIHHYFDISMDVLWDTIKERLPELKRQIEEILFEIERPRGKKGKE